MKDTHFPIIAIILCLAFSTTSFAADKVSSVLAPFSDERIAILTGEKAVSALGLKDGIIKGDVGLVATDKGQVAQGTSIGQCAVVKAGPASSICEVITLKKEIVGGDQIFFDRVTYSDPDTYAIAIAMLAGIVEPYEPYKQLRVMVYGIFDEHNTVTGLSEAIQRDLTNIFSQKKRIHLVDGREFKDFVFYPGADPDVLRFARAKMQKADIDALVVGRYASNGQTITLTLTELSTGGPDKAWQFSLSYAKYADSLTKVVLPPQEETRVDNYPCSVFVKGDTIKLQKTNDKTDVINHEAEGNAFTELNLKRSDFNILSPVDIKVSIDNAVVLQGQGPNAGFTVPVSPGTHRVAVSFRRGYFFDESLVYTSQKENRKEVNLELSKITNVAMDVELNPLFGKDTIGVKVFERVGKQQQVLKPIRRLEWDSTIETFKD